ncbi:MAG: AAA family ATPase [Candidatus Symbiothrix sp.]|jgi:predicted AAA+ superfamily ATPase|nr:AAA family ATPase [Candidatus Symbiothrix sp.]
MFERRIISSLRKWADSSHRKPLVLRGARQVGKTTIIEEFAKDFDTFLSLNLEKKTEKALFEATDTPEDVLTAIYLLKNEKKKAGRTLLFIDEVQSSKKAVNLLRYFYEDLPELYVIAAGSLLETLIDVQISFPVGRVDYLALRPCSFSEFLGAIGENQIKEKLLKCELPEAIHSRVMKLFNEFVLVGGMPEVVARYAENRDIVALRKVYDTLLNGYQDDVEKYASNKTERNVLRHILKNGWRYAGQRIKFECFGDSNYKSREVGEAFRTLEKAMVLELCYPTVSTDVPLSPDLKKSPKLLWLDTGIVNYAAKNQLELFGTQDISEHWKGKIAEHVIGQELLSHNDSVSTQRNLWVRDAKNSQAEIDFVIQTDRQLIPVEVKSGHNSKIKSMHLFMNESKHDFAIRFWNNSMQKDTVELPSGKKYTLLNLPFYYAEITDKILKNNDIE